MVFRRLSYLLCLVTLTAQVGLDRAGAQPDLREDRPVLPATLCGLSQERVYCYAARDAAPRAVSPEGARVLDFAVAPDAEWIVYRTDEGSVNVTGIYKADRAWTLDESAIPPAALDRKDASIAWSPDGLAIAYITADGFRVALPWVTGEALFESFNDRLYVNLRFSPGGARLAVQDDYGKWSIFGAYSEAGIRRGFRRAGTVERESDAGWLDDNSLIVAPAAGGLTRLNVIDAEHESGLITAWEKPEGQFARLVHAADGRLLALQIDPGEDTALPVAVAGDGEVSPLGERRVDLRVNWMAGGQYLVYITSGTPLTINPNSGREDALPIQLTEYIAWGAPDLLTAATLALDADLFYIAPDEEGTPQVWRLPGDGLTPLRQITYFPQGVSDFAVSPDRSLLAVLSGDRVGILPLVDSVAATPTPNLFRRPSPTPNFPQLEGAPGSRLLATVNPTAAFARALDWRPDGQQIAITDAGGVTLVDLPGASAITPRIVQFTGGAGYAYPQFSPDQAYLLVAREVGSGNGLREFSALSLNLNTSRIAGDPMQAVGAWWGFNALFSIQRIDQKTGTSWQLFAADTAGSALLVTSPWEILDARPLGGAPEAAGQSALFLRSVGWPDGPTVIQLAATTADPTQPEVRGQPIPLASPIFSPTGRFVAGLMQARDGKINQLVVLDLQNGRRVAIRNVSEIRGLRWVR